MLTRADLLQRQSLPLEAKVWHSQKVIREWYEHWGGHVYVSFSGGLDSLVLRHIVLGLYKDVECVFINTGNEYPEIVKFVRSFGDVTFIKPKMTFAEVLQRKGYPLFSKEVSQYIQDIRCARPGSRTLERRLNTEGRIGALSMRLRFLLDAPFPISNRCCDVLKKNPAHSYENRSKNKAIIGVKAVDSLARQRDYLKTGCNDVTRAREISRPLAIWTEEDVHEYIHTAGLQRCIIYNMGYAHTGCALCCFGCSMQKYPNNIQRLQATHPKLWAYGMNKLGFREVLTYARIPFQLDDYREPTRGHELYKPMRQEQIEQGNHTVAQLRELCARIHDSNEESLED